MLLWCVNARVIWRKKAFYKDDKRKRENVLEESFRFTYIEFHRNISPKSKVKKYKYIKETSLYHFRPRHILNIFYSVAREKSLSDKVQRNRISMNE